MTRLTQQKAVEQVTKFWDAFVSRDVDACAATLAEDVLRIGPREAEESDIIRGKEPYMEFLRDIKKTMPAHGGKTHEVVATPDGKRAYIHCMEIVAVDAGSTNTIEVSVMMLCHLNDDALISVIDIFWKQPRRDIGWTNAADLIEAAEKKA